jgi:hypothetical protein
MLAIFLSRIFEKLSNLRIAIKQGKLCLTSLKKEKGNYNEKTKYIRVSNGSCVGISIWGIVVSVDTY